MQTIHDSVFDCMMSYNPSCLYHTHCAWKCQQVFSNYERIFVFHSQISGGIRQLKLFAQKTTGFFKKCLTSYNRPRYNCSKKDRSAALHIPATGAVFVPKNILLRIIKEEEAGPYGRTGNRTEQSEAGVYRAAGGAGHCRPYCGRYLCSGYQAPCGDDPEQAAGSGSRHRAGSIPLVGGKGACGDPPRARSLCGK